MRFFLGLLDIVYYCLFTCFLRFVLFLFPNLNFWRRVRLVFEFKFSKRERECESESEFEVLIRTVVAFDGGRLRLRRVRFPPLVGSRRLKAANSRLELPEFAGLPLSFGF